MRRLFKDSDLKKLDLTGVTLLDCTIGTHTIPLESGGEGVFSIPQGKSFIVTEFQPFTGVPNNVLPGAYIILVLDELSFDIIETDKGIRLTYQVSSPLESAAKDGIWSLKSAIVGARVIGYLVPNG